jgi:hypothetical protein
MSYERNTVEPGWNKSQQQIQRHVADIYHDMYTTTPAWAVLTINKKATNNLQLHEVARMTDKELVT